LSSQAGTLLPMVLGAVNDSLQGPTPHTSKDSYHI
jgi:hypothetical protein